MGHKLWVRVAKCQLLVICLFMMLMALAVSIITVMTGWGGYFIILTKASPSESPVRGLHRTMLLYGSSVCVLLLLIALIISLSILRESQQLMGIGFLGYSCLFCVLMAGMTWIHESQSQVDVSFLDVYDSLYEQVLRSTSKGQRDYLLSIHETVRCCGKIRGHPSLPETFTMCDRGEEGQDCVSVISDALHIHWSWVTTLHLLCLILTVYGMFLSSFLFFSLPQGTSWDRRGKYSLMNASKCQAGIASDTPLMEMPPYKASE
ncbi:tetraspanin-32 isoform 1-T1 [Discoglossus pictus]